MYKKILLAVDLSEQTLALIAQGLRFSQKFGSELHLAHVIEPATVAYTDAPVGDFSSVQNQMIQQTEQQLSHLATESGINPARAHLLIGRIEPTLTEHINALGCELVIVGSQSSNLSKIFFGSTSSSLLRSLECDLLRIYTAE
ncbi:MAG: universal stress protein [Gammaproteobacteria bacterium]